MSSIRYGWGEWFAEARLPGWLARLSALSMLAQMLISGPLWGWGLRLFPQLPPWEILPLNLSEAATFVLFLGTALALAGTAFLPERFFRWTLGTLLVLLPLYVLDDVTRLQPWVYQDFLLFALFLSFFGKKINPIAATTALQPVRWLMVFTYLWSGLHKLNVHFRENVFVWLSGIFPATEPLGQSETWALSLGVLEALFALGLLLPGTWARRAALLGVLSMHGLILTLLVRDNWNHVVWPWNLQMMALAGLLFWPAGSRVRFPVRHPAQWAIVLLLGLIPGLYCFEKLDPSFSLSMYSGTPVEALWYWEQPEVPQQCLPKSAQKAVRPLKGLYLDEWSGSTVRVPVYAHPGLYRRLSRDFCSCALDPATRGLEITWFPRWSEKRVERIPCDQLLRER